MAKNIVIPYEHILRETLWPRLKHGEAPTQKAWYYLGKLCQHIERAQKSLIPEFNKFKTDMGEKYGMKNADGKPIYQDNGFPAIPTECKESYQEEFEKFMAQTMELEFPKQPWTYFANVPKVPLLLESLEFVTEINPEELDDGSAATNARAQLASIAGGHAG